MKKRNTCIAVLLSALLGISSICNVQAAENSKMANVQAVTHEKSMSVTQEKAQKAMLEKAQAEMLAQKNSSDTTKSRILAQAKATTTPKKNNSNIPVVVGVTGSEPGEQGNVTLGTTYGATDGTMGKRYLYAQKLETSGKGTLSFSVRCTEAKNATRNVVYGLFKEASLEDPIDKDSVDVVTKKGDHKTVVVKVPRAGTYYLGVYAMADSKDKSVSWKFTTGAIYWKGGNRTITTDKKIAVGHKSAQTNYFKMKTTESGYVTLTSSNPKSKIVLCDSKKNPLTKNTITKYGVTYGVPKGKTYYFKVYAPACEDGGYILVAKNRKISEKSGSSKARAVEMKKNETVKGTMQNGEKKPDWYKIKLTSKQSVELSWKARTNEKMKLAIYQEGRKMATKTLTYADASYKLKSVGKWPKGTYYLQVYTDSEKSSGWYILKWK